MTYPYPIPDLPTQFLPPNNWINDKFVSPKTQHEISYSKACIDNPKASIVILPGLSEFSEKYIETVRNLNENGFDCYVMDWAYQGRSSRYEGNAHKRHSNGYDSDLSDLDHLVKTIVPSNKPVHMLCHSMGGHIGLRYLIDYPNKIQTASLSAPMIDIKIFKKARWFLATLLSCCSKYRHAYIPKGRDWHIDNRKNDGSDIFSSDPLRDSVHNAWSLKDPALRIGNPTIQWLIETLKSIDTLESNVRKIKIPVLMAVAGHEELVSNHDIRHAADKMAQASILELPDAKHEILMETNSIRGKFLQETVNLFDGDDLSD